MILHKGFGQQQQAAAAAAAAVGLGGVGVGGGVGSTTDTVLGLKVVGGKLLQGGMRIGAVVEKVKKGSIADTVGKLLPGGYNRETNSGLSLTTELLWLIEMCPLRHCFQYELLSSSSFV